MNINTIGHNPPPGFKPVEPSLYRRVRVVVQRIFLDFWRSAGSYFSTAFNDKKMTELKKSVKPEILEVHYNLFSVLDQINRKKALGNAAVQEYCELIIEKTNSNYKTYKKYLCGGDEVDDIQEIKSQRIGIPIVIKSPTRDHIVSVLIDKDNKTIEYYDSKGLTIMDRKDEPLLFGNTTLYKAVEEIAGKFPGYALKENTRKHQDDCHNCGLFVCLFLRKRAMGVSFEKFVDATYSFSKINTVFRRAAVLELGGIKIFSDS